MDTSNFKEVFESPKVKALTTQVAALELEVVRLRNALETFITEHEECEDADGWMAQMCSMEALHVSDEALSTPFNPQALEALINKASEVATQKAMQACYDLGAKGIDYFNYASFITAIRTMPGVTLEDIK